MNKPKPKVEPPKDEKKDTKEQGSGDDKASDDNKPTGDDKSTGDDKAAGESDAVPPKEETDSPTEEPATNMDVDWWRPLVVNISQDSGWNTVIY